MEDEKKPPIVICLKLKYLLRYTYISTPFDFLWFDWISILVIKTVCCERLFERCADENIEISNKAFRSMGSRIRRCRLWVYSSIITNIFQSCAQQFFAESDQTLSFPFPSFLRMRFRKLESGNKRFTKPHLLQIFHFWLLVVLGTSSHLFYLYILFPPMSILPISRKQICSHPEQMPTNCVRRLQATPISGPGARDVHSPDVTTFKAPTVKARYRLGLRGQSKFTTKDCRRAAEKLKRKVGHTRNEVATPGQRKTEWAENLLGKP